jgi:hypothetical protein
MLMECTRVRCHEVLIDLVKKKKGGREKDWGDGGWIYCGREAK